MMEIRIDYPSPAQEQEIVMQTTSRVAPLPKPLLDRTAFLEMRDLVWAVPVPSSVAAFAVRLCAASRPGSVESTKDARDYVAWGAGPRGSQNLVLAAKAWSLLHGRSVPTVHDVIRLALPVLRHRLLVNHRAVGDGLCSDDIVRRLMENVPVDASIVE
jgi:MoxR-like ATPase